MTIETIGTRLPASLNDGAAWAAFDYVQKLPWTPRFASLDPLTLDIDHDVAFQVCLDQAGAFDFQKQARGFVAMRVLEIAESHDDERLRLLGIVTKDISSCAKREENALYTIRASVVSRLRSELTQALNTCPRAWAEQLEERIARVPEELRRQIAIYTGLDQSLRQKEVKAGLNYVFRTMEPEIVRDRTGLVLSGHERKLREVRAARSDKEPKARARNLVVRALEARLAALARCVGSVDLDGLLSTLEADLRERCETDGCWGLIDASIRRDRQLEGLLLPDFLPPEIWDLIRQQERRLPDASDLSPASPGHTASSFA
jgi:hypothetical protein